jgi:hypothetical protein
MRVIVDKRLQAVTAESAKPAAPAAATSAHSKPDLATATLLGSRAASSSAESSTPRSTGRGSVGIVAAMAAMSVQHSPTDISQPAAPTFTDATTLGAAHSCSDDTPGGPGASSTGGPALLAVQCGAGAVLRLSFGQLLQLSGGADIADVADAPAEAAAAVSTLTGAARASSGPSPQTPVSAPLRVCTPLSCNVRC